MDKMILLILIITLISFLVIFITDEIEERERIIQNERQAKFNRDWENIWRG